ncbi:CMRF35-like molecule 4 [Suricata suricatta]|uniref:CMRF35-like molecule 4 n=1 Tax=Suricata suricatta TaxID=37032 RepID=UPI001155F4B9|nr:CMRF35-like molecule 4 [Suricata suricatta]
MWLFAVLFLPIVQASYPLRAVSNAVSGPVRGLLTVQCRYDPGWETYKKWWCRGAEWSDCHILVTTNGSEEEAKNNHVSIKDNQKQFTFIVTMEELRWNYEDTYWCGIERYGTDLGVSVKVTIDPVTMQCHYGPRWETYVESWCEDADSNGCNILVETPGLALKKNRVSINQKKHTFSMTIWGE